MLNSKSFLAADFGAGSLKIAEFEPNAAGGLRLRQYGTKSLGIEVVGEGIETEAQRDILLELGCGHGQGFLFAYPQSASAIAAAAD